MTREKQERVLLASIVTAIVLFFVLITVTGYQLVKINAKKREYNALKKEIATLTLLLEETEDETERWRLEEAIEERARELGLRFPNEK